MTRTNNRSFGATLEGLARDIVDACRRTVRAIAVMPWPAMLACCIALAFVISILPLALFLFILFMGIKVIIGAFVIDHRRNAKQ